ncbi:MAG: cadherin-like domain-containing protein, partial [Cytophagales bacterium]|nr:cadherin-like domain-containing protein [Cytophagales bacterium]
MTKAKAVSAGFFCLLFFLLSSGFAFFSEDANSPPDFILNPAEISVLEDSPLQTVAVVDVNSIDWGEGDPEQEVQEFIVTVPPEDIALFSELPAIDNNGTLSFRPASDANGTSSVSVVLRDNGGTANGGIDFSEEKTLVIEIRNVNDPPDFVLNPSEISVLEDALLQTLFVVDVSAINWGEGDPEQEVQEFIVTVPPEDIAMFSELPAIDNNGTLSFRPASDANGTSSVSVVLRDNGGTANGGNDLSDPVSLTIVVDPVNDKPDFSFSQDILANNEDDGIQEISGFIQNISFGPENESSQTVLEYHIEVDNNDLFSQLPDISESGVLTYELSSDQYGTARVKVRLQDNGGTLNGGSDLSDEHEFSINVSPVNDRPIFQLAEESISLSEDSSPFAFSGFAEVITLGENETNQEVKEYVLTVYESENASLFSAGPVLSKNGELSFTLAADRFGEAEIAVQLFDDGGTSGGGVDSSLVQTFAVRVLPVNDAPTFEILKTQVEQLEDDGAVVIENFAHSVHLGNYESGQQVKQFELVFSEQTNPMLFVNVPEITQEGTLRFELAADQSGSVKVGARLRDDGGVESGGVDLSGEKSFDIVVQPVNDAPSFDLLISQLASVEDGGSVEQAGVIGNIFLGELETGQELESVLVEPSHPEFFSVQPQISAEGLLTFTLAPDRFGAVDLVVRVKDTGGTGNGGVDISQPQTMHLNVLPVNDRPVFSLAAATITLNEDHGNYAFADFLIEMDLGAYETEQQVEEIVVSEVRSEE